MRKALERGEEWGLSEDEIAFYDALEVNDNAVKVLGDPTLNTIARERVDTVRRNTTIDWTVRETVGANMRVVVERILRKYGSPDKQEQATKLVLEQVGSSVVVLDGSLRRRNFAWSKKQEVRRVTREARWISLSLWHEKKLRLNRKRSISWTQRPVFFSALQ